MDKQGPTVYHREVYSVSCNNLYGKEFEKYMYSDIYIYISRYIYKIYVFRYIYKIYIKYMYSDIYKIYVFRYIYKIYAFRYIYI